VCAITVSVPMTWGSWCLWNPMGSEVRLRVEAEV
jgi:hypothetical protein